MASPTVWSERPTRHHPNTRDNLVESVPVWVTIIITVIGSGGTAAAVTAWFERRLKRSQAEKADAEAHKTDIDGASAITDAAIALIQPLRDQITAMQHRLDQQDIKYAKLLTVLEQYAKHVEYLMTGISRLIEQLTNAGIVPCWTPTRWKPEPEVRE